MTRIVCIKGSLNKNSKTAIVMDVLIQKLKERTINVDIIDLRTLKMEFCDGRPTKDYGKDIQKTIETIKKSDAAIIGMPVYQYSIAGPLKNFIDITAEAFEYKFFSLVVNSGSVRSYLAGSELMKIMSFENFSIPVMPIVHSWKEDFEDGKLKNQKITDKINEMIDELIKHIKKQSL
jgi:FMN reductase